MASVQKSYFLSPSWNMQPDEVLLGSVVANVNTPNQPLSSHHLSEFAATARTTKETNVTGTVKTASHWRTGLFATFLKHVKTANVGYSWESAFEVAFSCQAMETKRFTPSSDQIVRAAEDAGVKNYLEIGGRGTKVFLLSGVKIAQGVTITTTERKVRGMGVRAGVEVSPLRPAVGATAAYDTTAHRINTTTIETPIVFAFEVQAIRLTRKGEPSNSAHIAGAMLGPRGHVEHEIETVEHVLDKDDLEDFGLEIVPGHDDEANEDFRIFVQCDE